MVSNIILLHSYKKTLYRTRYYVSNSQRSLFATQTTLHTLLYTYYFTHITSPKLLYPNYFTHTILPKLLYPNYTLHKPQKKLGRSSTLRAKYIECTNKCRQQLLFLKSKQLLLFVSARKCGCDLGHKLRRRSSDNLICCTWERWVTYHVGHCVRKLINEILQSHIASRQYA